MQNMQLATVDITAVTLKFRLLSIHFIPEAFETGQKIGCCAQPSDILRAFTPSQHHTPIVPTSTSTHLHSAPPCAPWTKQTDADLEMT
jgi:hypothetical protein